MSDTNYPNPDDFQDPLENYDPAVYDDPLEEALAEQTVEAIRHEPMATIGPETTVIDAMKKLAGLHIACLLVEQEGKLLGVLTDRDILNKVALEFDEVKDTPVRDVMTDDPVFVYDSDSPAAALSVITVVGHRHVPVLDLERNLVGIVSPQRVTDFLQQFFTTN